MNKTELRRMIREKKRTMTPAEIDEKSARLGELFRASEAYRNAKSIYGYLPYNQEVRTTPMLRQAQLDGKRVAVPKCYGDEMRFIWPGISTRAVGSSAMGPSSMGSGILA